jgi:competence protein ComEC
MKGTLRLPLVPVLAAYIFGLYIGDFGLPSPPRIFIHLFLIPLSLWAFLIAAGKPVWGSWVAWGLFFLLGIFSIQAYLHPQLSSAHISRFVGHDRISVEGIIDRPPRRSPEKTQLLIRCEKVILPKHQIPAEGHLLVFLKENGQPLRIGDRLRFRCALYRPRGFNNPGSFSYERYLAFERIYAIGSVSEEKGWVKIGKGFKNPGLLKIEEWRDHIRNFLEKETGLEPSAVLKALVLGEQENIPEEVKDQFASTGTAHLLAISGDHLGIVALLSFSFLIWIFKRSEFLLLSISVKKWAAGLTIPCILLYTFIAGGGISVVRAAIMVILFFLSILFSRERNLLYTLALAAFLILLFSPPSLFDVSFQLSFLAVLSILYLVPRILRQLKQEEIPFVQQALWKRIIQNYVRISLVVTVAAILGTTPLVALHFNRISLIGFVTNLFFIPWVGFLIVPLSLLASLTSFFLYPIAVLLIRLCNLLTVILLKGVALFASFPFASHFVSTPTPFEIVLFYLLLLSAVYLRKKSMRYLFLGICFLLVSDIAYWNVEKFFRKDLTITFIDVGHGDSILIEFPRGKRMLVDGGGLREDRFDIGKSVIAPFLWKRKIRRIDTLVLTHPDPDHLKGLTFIASHFSIGEFWDNGIRGDSEAYLQLEKVLLEKKIKWLSLDGEAPPRIVNGVRVFVLNPPHAPAGAARTASLLNNRSLVMKLQFKNIGILLASDIEKEAEDRMTKSVSLKADLLKVAHHGSSSSSIPTFLQKVNPCTAVVSSSEQDIQKLHTSEVLKRLRSLGVDIYRTDQHGAITAVTDGERITVRPFVKTSSP